MTDVLRHSKALAIAIIALAISASLAFGAEPPAAADWGLGNAAAHAGKTVPVQGGDDDVTTAGEDEDGDEVDAEETEAPEGDEESEEAGDNCLTDPTLLTEEELAEMRHGSIVCWAAHQETPEGYDNHGAFVREWAQSGKDNGPDAERSQGKGQAKGKNNGVEE